MTDYDAVAARYDAHFTRPVDRWEDARLVGLLRPHLRRDDNVLDLGCGTGWLLDHLRVARAHYTGLDASAGMLSELTRKHPRARVVKHRVGDLGWVSAAKMAAPCGPYPYDVVVATWAAHEFPLRAVLEGARALVRPGGLVLLHGQAPRYDHRRHYVAAGLDDYRGFLRFTPRACHLAGRDVGLSWLGAAGTGALPDALALWRPLWRVACAVPARHHWAFLARWRVP